MLQPPIVPIRLQPDISQIAILIKHMRQLLAHLRTRKRHRINRPVRPPHIVLVKLIVRQDQLRLRLQKHLHLQVHPQLIITRVRQPPQSPRLQIPKRPPRHPHMHPVAIRLAHASLDPPHPAPLRRRIPRRHPPRRINPRSLPINRPLRQRIHHTAHRITAKQHRPLPLHHINPIQTQRINQTPILVRPLPKHRVIETHPVNHRQIPETREPPDKRRPHPSSRLLQHDPRLLLQRLRKTRRLQLANPSITHMRRRIRHIHQRRLRQSRRHHHRLQQRRQLRLLTLRPHRYHHGTGEKNAAPLLLHRHLKLGLICFHADPKPTRHPQKRQAPR